MSVVPASAGVSPKAASPLFRNCGRGAHPDAAARRPKQYRRLGACAAGLAEAVFWGSGARTKNSREPGAGTAGRLPLWTRFVLSRDAAASKMSYAAGLPRAARDVAGFGPRIFITGGPHARSAAFKRAFLSRWGMRPVRVGDSHRLKKLCSNNGLEGPNRELAGIPGGTRVILDPKPDPFKHITPHRNFVRPQGLAGYRRRGD